MKIDIKISFNFLEFSKLHIFLSAVVQMIGLSVSLTAHLFLVSFSSPPSHRNFFYNNLNVSIPLRVSKIFLRHIPHTTKDFEPTFEIIVPGVFDYNYSVFSL